MVIMIIVINVRAKQLWDDRCELGTEDWAVHRITLSNVCTDVILGKILATNASIHEAAIHHTETYTNDIGIMGNLDNQASVIRQEM